MSLRIADRASTGELLPPEFHVGIEEAYGKMQKAFAEFSKASGETSGFTDYFPLPGCEDTTVIAFHFVDGKIVDLVVESRAKIERAGIKLGEW
jgi:hypothetical protein